jgi:hypothetical protein
VEELKRKVAETTEKFEGQEHKRMTMSFVLPKKDVMKYPWNALGN